MLYMKVYLADLNISRKPKEFNKWALKKVN